MNADKSRTIVGQMLMMTVLKRERQGVVRRTRFLDELGPNSNTDDAAPSLINSQPSLSE
jgi:hypothetical protein